MPRKRVPSTWQPKFLEISWLMVNMNPQYFAWLIIVTEINHLIQGIANIKFRQLLSRFY